MPSRISVVVPLYNHERYVEEAVYSIVTQSRPAAELIVVDDGSTDGSAQRMAAIARRRFEIVFWSQSNRGAHAALNTGIQRATGDIIAILNSDDVFEPRRLELAVGELEKRPGIDAIVSDMVFIDEASRETRHAWREEAMLFAAREPDPGRMLVNGNVWLSTSNLVARRAVFDEVGGFAALRYAHDLDFFLRLVAEGRGLAVLDEPLLRYRLHGSNTISEGPRRVKLEWAIATAFYLHRRVATHGWGEVGRHMDILERHTLLAPVLPLLAYFATRPARSLERHEVLTDPAIRDAAQELID